MAKKRVHELAKELGMQNKELVDWLHGHGYESIKSHSSSIDDDQASAIAGKIRDQRDPKPAVAAAPTSPGFVVRRRRPDGPTPTGSMPAGTTPAHGAPAVTHHDSGFRPAVVVRRPDGSPAGLPVAAAPVNVAPVQAAPSAVAAAAASAASNVGALETPAATPTVADPAAATPPGGAVESTAANGVGPTGSGPATAAGPAPTPGAEPTATGPAPMPVVPIAPVVVAPIIRGNMQINPEAARLRPTATQAVVISRPLIPVRRVTPPSSQYKPIPMAPGQRAIGAVRELKVVPNTLGHGREFIDVTKDKAGNKTRRGTATTRNGPVKELSKQELIDIASGRASLPVGRARKRRPTKKGAKTVVTTPKESKRVVRVEHGITVSELSQKIGVKGNDLIRKLMKLGVTAAINQTLDVATAQALVADTGWTVEKAAFEESEFLVGVDDKPEELVSRPPIVTIMGHVDHGKTSLLDAIRSAKVADGEAGGITQHIGAYSVITAKGPITFLDTPGHEAFTAMRARGAQVTDVAVLVVAADDGVMPQTIESINHAKAADVPVIVALNKIDKPGVNPDRVKQMLSDHGLVPEEWGGDTLMVPVSARTKQNLDKLLESIALQSEILELVANPNKPAIGAIIEAKLEKGRGPVATVLVQEGTLRVGDAVVTGTFYGKIRALVDDRGRMVKDVKPGYCAEITGLSGAPSAGDEFNVVKDVKLAEEIAHNRELRLRAKDVGKTSKISLDEIFAKASKPAAKELKVILKADVQGSVEAVAAALIKLSTPKVKVTVLHKAVGAVTESDVNLAKASSALCVGFHTKPESKVNELASRYGVQIHLFDIIYEAIDAVKLAMEGLLDVILREKAVGKAEVLQLFSVPKLGNIAGSKIVSGKISRACGVRVVRNGKTLHTGKIASLRRFKDDVKEVAEGFECGIGIEGFNELQPGDLVEAFEIERIRQSL